MSLPYTVVRTRIFCVIVRSLTVLSPLFAASRLRAVVFFQSVQKERISIEDKKSLCL